MKIENREIQDLLLKYKSNMSGLSLSQVEENRKLYGDNTITKEKKSSFLKKFLLQFKNLMVLVLLISAIISGLIAIFSRSYSDLIESGLILVIVLINALVGTIQEKKAENTLELLAKQSSTHAKVYRDNKLEEIDIGSVVVGDIVELKAGSFVPADMRLIESSDLSCDESSLTGESKKAYKDANSTNSQSTSINRENMCYKGTTVISGTALGIVTATGMNAEIGKIANLISTQIKEKTPLEKNIDKIGKVITIGVSLIAIVVFIVQLIFSNKINVSDAFMTAIALAVAAIPESLPAVITIIMALGVQKLARHKAIVKTLSSVETLGCCTCICTDKTGTLTQNKMSVVSIYSSNTIYNSFEKINSNVIANITTTSLLCSNTKIDKNNVLQGDATEKALYCLCKKLKANISSIRAQNPRIYQEPFSSAKKYMITINKDNNNNLKAYIKGASDVLLDKCSYYLMNDKIIPMTKQIKEQILKAQNTFTAKSERVILLGTKTLDTINDDLDSNYVLIGLLGLIDPPREEVYSSIKKCHKAGLKPIMITGDHKDTAFSIAKSLNICENINQVITGNELDKLSNEDLNKIIYKYSVFARVTPSHKLRIVRAYKNMGEVVAMTGDGINDAPSIKQADIGVCMGLTGTDVTKSVSDIIITDDNFNSIVLAVSTGRTIYNNIQKALQFLISTNAVEVLGLFIVSLLMRDSIFLLPSQILFINLITDILPAFALGIEPPEENIMNKPPRQKNETIFSGEIGTAIIYQAFVQTIVVLVLFVYAYHTYSNQVATTMVFLTICLMQILHALNCKTNQSLFTINIFKNKTFNLSFIFLLGLILCVGLIPGLQTLFSITSLSVYQWIIVLICSISIVPLVELFKFILKPRKR